MGAIVGLVLSCALPLDGKTACNTSQDCVDARVCVDGRCHDGACEAWCSAVCDAANDCEQGPTSDCDSRCIVGDVGTELPALTESSCKQLWDEWSQDDECYELACVLACAPICDLARTCGFVLDESACFAGCIARNESCGAAIPSNCISVPLADVLCWEDARVCQ